MQKRRGIIFPRIAEEIVDYDELLKVWQCSYLTAYRILYGYQYPNHKRKEALSDYLGIPIDELFRRTDSVSVSEGVASHIVSSEENGG